MDKKDVDEIIACLPQDRSRFRYFKDYYALQLLQWVAADGTTLEQLRKGPFARLLSKPVTRPLLALCGDGLLDAARVQTQWHESSLPFLLTLGRWQGGGSRQTSRPGWNLVLQLNFTLDHDRGFRKLFAPHHRYLDLNYLGHPVLTKGERSYYRQTLAWARLDIDLTKGEALVEEIQTDWVREAAEVSSHLERCRRCERPRPQHRCKGRRSSLVYLDQVLAPYAKLWDQAMLSATLFFLVDELGIRDIWYHDWETGNLLKGLTGEWLPPRSLYTELPRRFCFRMQDGLPDLLQNRKTHNRLRRFKREPRCYRLHIPMERYHA